MSTDARLQEHDIRNAVLSMSRRATKLSPQPVSHVPVRPRFDPALSPHAPNRHCARHPESRLHTSSATRIAVKALARELTEPRPFSRLVHQLSYAPVVTQQ